MKSLSPIARHLGSRLGQLALVMWLVVTLVFLMVRAIPGDPATATLGSRATPETIEALRQQLGLDQSVALQYWKFITDLLSGTFGTSLTQQGRPVADIIFPAFGVTAAVVGVATVLSLLIAVPWGLIAGLTRKRWVDVGNRTMAMVMLASPPFWVGLLLISTFAVGAGIFPAGGWAASWPGNLRYVWLPAFALCVYLIPVVMRVVRQTASDVAQSSFVEAAITRGVSPSRIVAQHILPNSLLPVITIVFVNVGVLLSGAIVIEAVFALPGLGTVLNMAIAELDYQVIQSATVLAAACVVVANMLGDTVNLLVDPRIRTRAS